MILVWQIRTPTHTVYRYTVYTVWPYILCDKGPHSVRTRQPCRRICQLDLFPNESQGCLAATSNNQQQPQQAAAATSSNQTQPAISNQQPATVPAPCQCGTARHSATQRDTARHHLDGSTRFVPRQAGFYAAICSNYYLPKNNLHRPASTLHLHAGKCTAA